MVGGAGGLRVVFFGTPQFAVPTLDALRVMLAWTGWRKTTRFTDYRPGSSEALFLCEKTDELRDGADLSDVVTPHRPSG